MDCKCEQLLTSLVSKISFWNFYFIRKGQFSWFLNPAPQLETIDESTTFTSLFVFALCYQSSFSAGGQLHLCIHRAEVLRFRRSITKDLTIILAIYWRWPKNKHDKNLCQLAWVNMTNCFGWSLPPPKRNCSEFFQQRSREIFVFDFRFLCISALIMRVHSF